MGAFASLLVTLFLVSFLWNMGGIHILGSILRAAGITLDVFLVILGALFFLDYIKKCGIISEIEAYLTHLSSDRRVQAVFIAWLFGSVIEGTSGFGTPAAIVAPLLVAIGFPKLKAILIALLANTTAVSYGAVGTPIRVGFSGYEATGISEFVALINLFSGFIVPFLIIFFVVSDEPKKKVRLLLECVPFALFSGAAFLIPYFVIAQFSAEFPSLIGALIGLVVVYLGVNRNFLMPKNTFRFHDDATLQVDSLASLPSLKVFLPYILLILFLFAGKLVFRDIRFNILSVSGIETSTSLFNPGFAFFLSVTALLFLRKDSCIFLKDILLNSAAMLARPRLSIFFITSMVQIMIYSKLNQSNQQGMIESLSSLIGTANVDFVAPFIGAFGAFLTGSATVSNLLFSEVQVNLALSSHLSVSLALALQLVGASVGNMISLFNILAVSATVKVAGYEREVLKSLIFPCIIYLLLAAFVAKTIF